jgi:dihydroorotate dehydrogenase (NAD+) catalytic subunit
MTQYPLDSTDATDPATGSTQQGSTLQEPVLSGSNIDTKGVDTRVSIRSLTMNNPVTVASGTFGSGKEYASLVPITQLGAIVTKGVSAFPWTGNDGTRLYETASGMLNSIGLQNPGVDAFIENDLSWLSQNAPDLPVIVNVCGQSAQQYVEVIEKLEDQEHVSAFEINISCPNVDCGGLAFGTDPTASAEVTAICRKATKKPLIMKLSPNVTDITGIARACESEGADGLSLINTLLGMAINIDKRSFIFQRKIAGLSGPAIKPVALRMVHDVSSAVSVPIIGMGGITTAEDAIEFMLAGASAVAIGTGNFVDPGTAIQCIEGIAAYCKEHGFERVRDLVGAMKG